MFSYFVLTTATLFICNIQSSKCIPHNSAQSLSECGWSYRTRSNVENNNVSVDHSIALKLSQTPQGNSYENDEKFNYRENLIRAIRSNNLSAYFNGSGVDRPNPRIVLNKTISSKTGREQVHLFFADKAREDAYQKTEAKEHPYSVVFLAHSVDGGITVCSGTLISVRLVLTAAHCLVDLPTVKIDVFGGITINIFKQPIPTPLPDGSQMRTSKTFYPHPKYDPMSPNADYDIAMIKITPEFELTEYVKPVEITSTAWNHTGLRPCLLTAFGSVRDEPNTSPDDFIRKTQMLEVEKPCYCHVKLRRSMGIGATSRYICIRPKEDFGICAGDSGGGLVCDGELTGVVSISVNLDPYYPCKRSARLARSKVDPYYACKRSARIVRSKVDPYYPCKRSARIVRSKVDPYYPFKRNARIARSEELQLVQMCGDKDTLSIFQDVSAYLTWIKKSAVHSYSDDTSVATSKMLNLNSCLDVLFFSLSVTLLKGIFT